MPVQPELKRLLDKTKEFDDPTLELVASLIEYVVTLHDRIEKLEKGAQNMPFILPKKDRPVVPDPDVL